jgi:hypothetical protein
MAIVMCYILCVRFAVHGSGTRDGYKGKRPVQPSLGPPQNKQNSILFLLHSFL